MFDSLHPRNSASSAHLPRAAIRAPPICGAQMRIRSPRVTELQGLLQFRTSAFASVWSVWRPEARRGFKNSSGTRHVRRRWTPPVSRGFNPGTALLISLDQPRRSHIRWLPTSDELLSLVDLAHYLARSQPSQWRHGENRSRCTEPRSSTVASLPEIQSRGRLCEHSDKSPFFLSLE